MKKDTYKVNINKILMEVKEVAYLEYENYFMKLKESGSLARFGKVFATKSKYYFFDTGTGKVLECSEAEYKVFRQLTKENSLDFSNLDLTEEELNNAIVGIMEAIETEKIFQATPLEKFDGTHFQDLEHVVPQNMQQVILEVTEECNLRCTYCIYNNQNDGFRDFGKQNMSEKTAIKAIKYILETSMREEIYVGFYGGEPLLRFDLLQKCVSYALEHKANKKVTFSMTTNGILMTPEKAQYFASIPDFSIMFSIDGDKLTHDEHRKLKNGKGSFDLTLQGYQNALDAYGKENRNKISISTVVSPPYSKQKFDAMQNFFETYAKGLQLNCTYVEHSTREVFETQWREDEPIVNRMPLLAWEKDKSPKEKMKSFTKGAQTGSFLKIHKRPIVNEPISSHKFNGCCLPGTRRLYVTVQGDFLPCERTGLSPKIGDVEHGLDIAAIKKYYVDDYMEKSVSDCRECWASLICGICYAQCFNEAGIDINQKRKMCKDERYTLEQNLIYYHETLEEDPQSLEVLNDMIIS